MTNARTARLEREQKAADARAAAARRESRRRSLAVSSAVVAVLVVVVAAFVLVRTSGREAASSGGATPANVTAAGGIVVGRASAPVTLVAYEDFQCPVCAQFESLNAAQLGRWIADGTVKVEYRPIAFLDRSSADEYSTRALNAAAAVADSAPAAFAAFHTALFAQQPAEGGPGLSDARLVELAEAAGAPRAAVERAVRDRTYEAWTRRVTEASSKAGVTGTPTVQVDGTTLDGFDAATVAAAVTRAAAAAR